MNGTRTLLRRVAAALLLAPLAGCALPGFLSFKGTKVDWSEVTLAAAPLANDNSPVAVDIVFALDDAMTDRLAELPAAKWFAARADLLKTYPKSLSYRTWELVPGQTLRVAGDSFGSPRVAAVFVYADYVAPGAHRVRVESLKGPLLVRFEARSFDAGPPPAP
ncbi:hypothetical protein [Xylophilus sp.]|uniref:hypothetical protein n=1 Tax=Xylophilus sp. TaxID=2653893 RepID=UPI0013B9DEE6|nr:hypothetical protein [Xylophilus sp.]KAF1045347.1 MAG: hypothetical protein GAK38_03059 [Xylophilus sp.]